MTTQQHPAQFDWATELLDAEGHVTLSAKEAHEIGARLRSMGEKLKAYEDLDEAASDVQLLRMGYAAARLEIESLRARSVAPDPRPVVEMCAKALAEELAAWDIDPPLHHVKEAHDACELWLAAIDADRAMRAAQPASGLDPEFGPMLDFANAGEIAFYDYAVAQHCRATLDILDGKDNGAGACNEPWASVRKRLLSIVELHQSSSATQGGFVPAGAQQPAPSAASKAVLAAIRAANMQLVRTGDDEFMLVTYKNAKAQCDGGKCGIGGYCDDCPTPQADSQPAPVAAFEVADAMADSQYLAGVSAGWNAANADDPNAALQKLHESRAGYLKPLSAARAQADSVTAPAGGGVARALSDGQIEAMPVWRNFVGLWPESRREIVDAVVDLLTTPPTQAADSVLEDAARLEALHAAVTAIYLDDSSDFKSALGAVVRHLDPKLAGDLLAWPKRAYDISQARLDAARKQGANHD